MRKARSCSGARRMIYVDLRRARQRWCFKCDGGGSSAAVWRTPTPWKWRAPKIPCARRAVRDGKISIGKAALKDKMLPQPHAGKRYQLYSLTTMSRGDDLAMTMALTNTKERVREVAASRSSLPQRSAFLSLLCRGIQGYNNGLLK